MQGHSREALMNQYAHVMRQCGRFRWDDEKERCGILVYTPGRPQISFVELENASKRWTEFQLYRYQVNQWLRKRPQTVLWGYLHTHPGKDLANRYPSPQDLNGAVARHQQVHALWFPWTRSLAFYNGMGDTTIIRARPKGFTWKN